MIVIISILCILLYNYYYKTYTGIILFIPFLLQNLITFFPSDYLQNKNFLNYFNYGFWIFYFISLQLFLHKKFLYSFALYTVLSLTTFLFFSKFIDFSLFKKGHNKMFWFLISVNLIFLYGMIYLIYVYSKMNELEPQKGEKGLVGIDGDYGITDVNITSSNMLANQVYKYLDEEVISKFINKYTVEFKFNKINTPENFTPDLQREYITDFIKDNIDIPNNSFVLIKNQDTFDLFLPIHPTKGKNISNILNNIVNFFNENKIIKYNDFEISIVELREKEKIDTYDPNKVYLNNQYIKNKILQDVKYKLKMKKELLDNKDLEDLKHKYEKLVTNILKYKNGEKFILSHFYREEHWTQEHLLNYDEYINPFSLEY